jgi:hypothetical protein
VKQFTEETNLRCNLLVGSLGLDGFKSKRASMSKLGTRNHRPRSASPHAAAARRGGRDVVRRRLLAYIRRARCART